MVDGVAPHFRNTDCGERLNFTHNLSWSLLNVAETQCGLPAPFFPLAIPAFREVDGVYSLSELSLNPFSWVRIT